MNTLKLLQAVNNAAEELRSDADRLKEDGHDTAAAMTLATATGMVVLKNKIMELDD